MSGLRWKQTGQMLVLVGAFLWTSTPVAAQPAGVANPDAIRGNQAARCGSCHESTSSSAGGDESTAAAASIEFTELLLQGCDLRADVQVGELHGLARPAEHPQRRLWIEFVVRDVTGEVLFRSGLTPGAAQGSPASDVHPHHTVIIAESQVQIYEAVPAGWKTSDPDRAPGSPRFVKDNRLFPSDPTAGSPELSRVARGAAAADPDFRSTADRVVYAVDLAGSAGPYELEAVLHYEPVAPHWAEIIPDRELVAGASPRPLARVTATVD